MNKEYISRRVSQIINLLNPVIMLSFKDITYLVMLLPIISLLAEIIIEYFFQKKDIKLISQDLPSITVHKDHDLTIFEQICWYINKYCDIVNLSLDGFYKNLRLDSEINRYMPLYSFGNEFTGEFKYNNEIIYIQATQDKSQRIILSSKGIDILKNFILESSKEYINYLNINYSKTYTLFTISPDQYGSNKWTPLSINVIKNKKNVFLNSNNKNIYSSIDNFYKSKENYHDKGIPHKKGILLYGLPGTGKSSVVYSVAYEFKMNIYKLSLIGLDDKDIIKYVQYIPSRSIVLIEDIDTITSLNDRQISLNNKNKKKNIKHISLVNEEQSKVNLETLLSILDGYTYLNECVIFFTTNFIEKLDRALIRPGRMDEKYEFGYLTNNQIKEILAFYHTEHLYDEYHDKEITSAELIQKCLTVSFLSNK